MYSGSATSDDGTGDFTWPEKIFLLVRVDPYLIRKMKRLRSFVGYFVRNNILAIVYKKVTNTKLNTELDTLSFLEHSNFGVS